MTSYRSTSHLKDLHHIVIGVAAYSVHAAGFTVKGHFNCMSAVFGMRLLQVARVLRREAKAPHLSLIHLLVVKFTVFRQKGVSNVSKWHTAWVNAE